MIDHEDHRVGPLRFIHKGMLLPQRAAGIATIQRALAVIPKDVVNGVA